VNYVNVGLRGLTHLEDTKERTRERNRTVVSSVNGGSPIRADGSVMRQSAKQRVLQMLKQIELLYEAL